MPSIDLNGLNVKKLLFKENNDVFVINPLNFYFCRIYI